MNNIITALIVSLLLIYTINNESGTGTGTGGSGGQGPNHKIVNEINIIK